VATSENNEIRQAFRPRARLLQLLGDQLIGSAKLAVFELVKNAYDADAESVDIWLRDLESENPTILIEDNGQGMSLDTIRDVWLVPGDDYREKQRLADKRSPRFGRLPLGEKGVGRFAVHKLGDRIKMVTKTADSAECVVVIDWREMAEKHFLEEAQVSVTEREAKIFTDGATGTAILISDLREREWSRREVRDLYRQVTAIASPFVEQEADFQVTLHVPDNPTWVKSMPGPGDMLAKAPWYFRFEFDGQQFSYVYEFRGVPGLKADPRRIERSDRLQILEPVEQDDLDLFKEPKRKKTKKAIATPDTLHGIGPISGQLFMFDRDPAVLRKYGESRFLERYLDQNGGVRVYRDNIRVYNYGEPGDDWLGLDLSRVNAPGRRLSRNILVGVVDVGLSTSPELREKTNREGFVDNAAYERFRQVVSGIISVAATERSIDKERLRLAAGGARQPTKDLQGPIANLRKIALKHNLGNELEPSIIRIERDYNQLRDNFLRAGISQAGLAVVFHEIERGVAVLSRAIERDEPAVELKEQASQLQSVLEISTQLLRKGDKEPHSLKHLVRRARDLNSVRFRVHDIKLRIPALEDGAADSTPVFAFGLVLGALTNLIDNAIHWMGVAKSDDGDGVKRLFISVDPDFTGGPAIIVADNGTGFIDDPAQLVEPFFSRRPDGMGLGLYYSNMVMQLSEGQLLFPTPEEVDVPDEYGGAIIAMVFKGGTA
jgi:hypothetical protein